MDCPVLAYCTNAWDCPVLAYCTFVKVNDLVIPQVQVPVETRAAGRNLSFVLHIKLIHKSIQKENLPYCI